MTISIIVAFDERRLIGNNNQLPWHLPADLKHFKSITMGHTMIMGRKTFESIGKPLPGRVSIIISRQLHYSIAGCQVYSSLDSAIEACSHLDEVFFIGGSQIFKAALPRASKLYITKIHHTFEGDTFFPEIDYNEWTETSSERHPADEKNPWDYSYINYQKKIPFKTDEII